MVMLVQDPALASTASFWEDGVGWQPHHVDWSLTDPKHHWTAYSTPSSMEWITSCQICGKKYTVYVQVPGQLASVLRTYNSAGSSAHL